MDLTIWSGAANKLRFLQGTMAIEDLSEIHPDKKTLFREAPYYNKKSEAQTCQKCPRMGIQGWGVPQTGEGELKNLRILYYEDMGGILRLPRHQVFPAACANSMKRRVCAFPEVELQ